jgi:uncharacterized protein
MKRFTGLALGAMLLLSHALPGGPAAAETVASLPAPTGYVNDFAHVLSPATQQQLEALCAQVDRKAKAQIAVVTIGRIDGDQSIEEFSTALEDKWKVGTKGTDRGVLMLFVMNPRRNRIEVGYGLEGILNDAKVGDIGRSMVPAAEANDYDTAIPLGVRQVAQVIAADAGVTLTQPAHRYHEQQVGTPVRLSLWQVVVGGAVLLFIVIVLVSTGNAGWVFFLLLNMMGGGGGGGGGGDDNEGGGFGGFGGGRSGGGGASGDA